MIPILSDIQKGMHDLELGTRYAPSGIHLHPQMWQQIQADYDNIITYAAVYEPIGGTPRLFGMEVRLDPKIPLDSFFLIVVGGSLMVDTGNVDVPCSDHASAPAEPQVRRLVD